MSDPHSQQNPIKRRAGVALRIKKAEDSLRNQKVLLEDEVRERTKALMDSDDGIRVDGSFGVFYATGCKCISTPLREGMSFMIYP